MKKLIALLIAALFLLSACAERDVSSASGESTAPVSSEAESPSAPESSAEPVSAGESVSVPAGSSAEGESTSAEESTPASETVSEAASTSTESAASESTASESKTESVSASVDDWRLVLVNPWHKLEGEMDIDLVLPPSGRNENRHMVDRRIVDDLEEMIAAAKADGVSLLIDYGYRSFAQSEALFEKQINRQLAANPSYTREQAEEAAKAWVAPPGTSDHHTGLALDIVTPDYQMLDDGFADTPAGQWMAKHSWEYGFVIRFPQGKTDITGIAYESWHLRYVGRDNAKIMYENNWCLEEYLEYLEKQQ